jgi:hypothetical protein
VSFICDEANGAPTNNQSNPPAAHLEIDFIECLRAAFYLNPALARRDRCQLIFPETARCPYIDGNRSIR